MDPLRGGRRRPFSIKLLAFFNSPMKIKDAKNFVSKSAFDFSNFGLKFEQTYEFIHVGYTTFSKHLMQNVISVSSKNSTEFYCLRSTQTNILYEPRKLVAPAV